MAATGTWDETIVPALRKRLEGESRVLAKRMSVASIAAPSAIPRPSLQYPRTPAEHTAPRPNGTPKRTRTHSQPPSPDGVPSAPLSDVKPTRIPTIVARTRTTSASSHARSTAQRADSRNANHRPHQLPTPDPTPPEPVPRSRIQDHRPSTDSEERPFEHWYRGDVHRNGGVGELRVAKHVEMLQIANYGHNIQTSVRGQSRDLSAHMDSVPRRKRADSVGAGTHDSLYLDDEPTKDIGMVLDESPLTDIEADPDTDPETFYDAYAGADDTVHSSFSAPSSLPDVSLNRSETPTRTAPVHDQNTTPKHATRTPSDPLRSSTPSAPLRVSTESSIQSPPTSGSRSRSLSSTTSPASQSSDQSHTKRRAKSPLPSTPKKPKTKAKPTPAMLRDPRTSIAMYPTPEGDIVNAIPTWTQPVQKSGNWDEVVLPVVARKRGLESLYEQADGSPKPKSSEYPPIQPAPGTFGYDFTKYRPPRNFEEIQMNEFGRTPQHTPPPEEDPVSRPPESPTEPTRPIRPFVPPIEPIRPDPRKTVPNPPDSPAPFSRYRAEHQVPTINVTRPSSEFPAQRRQELEEDDVAGGCCKCIVM